MLPKENYSRQQRENLVADIFRSAEYARAKPVRAATKVSDCLNGKCACKSASECRFKRCSNCDYPTTEDGKTLVDHSCDDLDCCPFCAGPLNDRRIYGSLVD